MSVTLFAGIYVSNIETARDWYERLLGAEPVFVASETEIVWELAEERYLAIEQNPEHAGHSIQTVFVDDFDSRIEAIATRGIEPGKRETYPNGVRKALFYDPDGNEVGIGGDPVEEG